jgi:ABC-2 type transport system permease protein
MNKVLLVARREFRQRIRKRAFLLTSIGMPLIILVLSLTTGVTGSTPQRPTAQGPAGLSQGVIGYVDQANVIHSLPQGIPAASVVSFPDVASARAALAAGRVVAYYVVPPDYRDTGQVQRVSKELPLTPTDTELLDQILVTNLLAEANVQNAAQLRDPFGPKGLAFVNVSSQGETGAQGGQMVGFFVAIVVMLPLFTSGGFLFQSLVQEKSSRVLEILLLSLRPRQLLTGKLIGLGALTLVQYLIWIALAGLAFLITGQGTPRLLAGVSLTPAEVLLIIPYALGGYLLYASLMAGVGALSPDMESSRAWVFVLSLPMLVPLYVWTSIVSAPNGPLAVALSLIPFSAPMTMLMRMTGTSVPAPQIVLSLALLLLGGIGIAWLMARLFRVQTLLSGESLSLARVWAALRG